MTAVLVLDIGMQPLKVQPLKKAIKSLVKGKTEVIEYSRDRTIRSGSEEFPAPSVLRLLRPLKWKRFRIKFSRINVYARDNFTCQYCGKQFPTEELSYDHVLPRAQGGTTCWENIVTCCSGPSGCNIKKGSQTPEQAGMPLLSTPRRPTNLPMISVAIDKNTPPEWRDYWKVPLLVK
jgi:5-methylcytosine-specific restriction endonuclease McrA